MSAHLGVLTVYLRLENPESLKDKRKVVRSILEKTRLRFRCAASETDLHDHHTEAELTFVLVGNDTLALRSLLDRMLAYVEGQCVRLSVELTDEISDVEAWEN